MYLKNNIGLYRRIIAFQSNGVMHYGISLLLLGIGIFFIFSYQYLVFKIMRGSKMVNPIPYLVFFYYSEILLRALFQPAASFNLKPYLILNIPKLKLAKLFYWISYINLINFIAVCFAVSFVIFGWDVLPGSQFAWLLSCIAITSIFNMIFCLQKLFHPAFYYTILLVVVIGGFYYLLQKYTTAFQLLGFWIATALLWMLQIIGSLFFRKQILKHLYIE